MFISAGLAVLSCVNLIAAYASQPIGIFTNSTNTFDCPPTTRASLNLDELQCAMDDFALTFYTKKDVTAAMTKYTATNYIQHNPDILDGRDAALAFLTPLFGNVNNTFELARVMVGPEYTTIHVRATLGPSAVVMSVVDIYRTQGSCIVEHWDCMQLVANETISTHPYF